MGLTLIDDKTARLWLANATTYVGRVRKTASTQTTPPGGQKQQHQNQHQHHEEPKPPRGTRTRRQSWFSLPMWSFILDIIPPLVLMHISLGYVHRALEFLGRIFGWGRLRFMGSGELEVDPKVAEGYAPIIGDMEKRYRMTIYGRMEDLHSRPICSAPGATFQIGTRKRPLRYTGYTETLTGEPTINMGSYNYLGFAKNTGPIPLKVAAAIRKYGLTYGGPSRDLGSSGMHRSLEKDVARFVGKEDALLCPMGFATNSMHLPALADKRTLVISDKNNHSSLVLGCRLSGATIRVFKHNDTKHLETILRRAVILGDRTKCRKWNKILIIVEGAYSMEGSVANLPEIIRLKKKYKAYLYVDEAHSVGALGPNGRGVADYYDVNTDDIDIMMGTFTKSFAAFGGYIAANKEIINHLRANSPSPVYAQSMCPAVVEQIRSTLACIEGTDGTSEGKQKIRQLHDNAVYVRERLTSLGFHVYGNKDCPIVPVHVSLAALTWLSRMMFDYGVGVVTVTHPATPLLKSRIRLCLSSDHTREHLDKVIDLLDQVGFLICAKRYKPEGFAQFCAKNARRRANKGNCMDFGQYAFGARSVT